MMEYSSAFGKRPALIGLETWKRWYQHGSALWLLGVGFPIAFKRIYYL